MTKQEVTGIFILQSHGFIDKIYFCTLAEAGGIRQDCTVLYSSVAEWRKFPCVPGWMSVDEHVDEERPKIFHQSRT